MRFELIPAVDVRAGRCVRLLQGRYEDETVYSDDPVAMAQRWQREGATRLHVVDLDGARSGAPQNLEVIAAIVNALDIPVQVGGGVRSEATIESLLALGAARVIIGSRACHEPEFAHRVAARWGDRIIVGIDAKDGRVAVHGWQDVTEVTAAVMARQMQDLGVARIIFTDISRDGTLAGPNLESLREVVGSVTIPVIASGGVSTSDDIVKLSTERGVEGVIVGKALYAGSIKLSAALSSLNPEP